MHSEIIHSINSLNFSLFYDLGGTSKVDLNFKQNNTLEFPSYPIFCAAAKGSHLLIKMLLMNKSIDIQVSEKSGINAFWIAALFGHGFVMRELANAGINVLSTNHRGLNALHIACA